MRIAMIRVYQIVLISTVASKELGSKNSNKDDIE